MTTSERARAKPTRRRRVVSVLAAGVLGVCSLGLLTVGGFAESAGHGDGGYVNQGHASYRTDSYAVVSEPYNWSTATFLLGDVHTVRIRVTPASGSTPAFVGLARPEALRHYLRGVGYATAHPAANYHVRYTRHEGTAPSTPPADADLWAAKATGTGTLTLRFPAHAQPDDLVLVAMNADGSPSVRGRVATASTVPSLPWIGAAWLAGGAVLLCVAVLLLVRPRTGAVRRVRAAV